MSDSQVTPVARWVSWCRAHPAVLGVAALVVVGVVLSPLIGPPTPTVARRSKDLRSTGFQSTDKVMGDLMRVMLPVEAEIREADEEGRKVSPGRLRSAGLTEAEVRVLSSGGSLWAAMRARVVRMWNEHGQALGVQGFGEKFATSVDGALKDYAPYVRLSEALHGVGAAFQTLIGDAMRDSRLNSCCVP